MQTKTDESRHFLVYDCCDDVAQYIGEEDNKRIEYSLQECHRDHVTIQHMSHLVSDDRSDLIIIHQCEQS